MRVLHFFAILVDREIKYYRSLFFILVDTTQIHHKQQKQIKKQQTLLRFPSTNKIIHCHVSIWLKLSNEEGNNRTLSVCSDFHIAWS